MKNKYKNREEYYLKKMSKKQRHEYEKTKEKDREKFIEMIFSMTLIGEL